jgi:hypothetical protein
MNARAELEANIRGLASRSVQLMDICHNEESTKLYLVLPFIGLLGYSYSDPSEVFPEYDADFGSKYANRVDFVVLRSGQPIVAIECKKVGADLTEARGQLRGYFNSLPTAKLAILTNGVLFEFFVDSVEPNLMDDEPFLTLDLPTISRGKIPDEVIEALEQLRKGVFDPAAIAELAHIQLTRKRLRATLVAEASAPSEEFCRCVLQKAGVKNVRKAAIDRYYAPMIKTAISEALILPVVRHLREASADEVSAIENLGDPPQRVITTERELSIFAYVRRRLAFLVQEEKEFNAIEDIEYKDYIGKLIIYYGRERKGRLFDYIEGPEGCDKFVFPEPFGEITTYNLLDIDEPLKAIFARRVQEMGGGSSARAMLIA